MHNEFTGFASGDPVTVQWKGSPRHGVVTAPPEQDSLPTGAVFVPVHFDDDGSTHKVDTRVVYLGHH